MSEDTRVPPSGAPPDHDSSSGIARNALYLVLGQVISTALAIVLSATLGRFLGPSDFGVYYLITTMCLFAYVFVEWGQPLFVIREVAREPARSGELLGTTLGLRAAVALAVMAPAGLLAWALGYGPRTTWLGVGLILANLPLSLAQAYGMVFRGRDRMGLDAVVWVSMKAIALVVAVPALILGSGIPGVVVAQGVAGLVALAIARRLYRRLAVPPLRVALRTAKEVLSAGVPLLAMTAAIAVQPYLDAILLSKLAPAEVVGWFGAARNILGTLSAPAVILGAAAYPRLARASADGRALQREARSAFRPLLWLGALAGTGTYLFATAAVALLYGSRGFGPAATVLQVFAPVLFILFIDILLGNIIYAAGGGTIFAIAKVASVLVGSALDLLLIPVFQQRFGNGGIGVVVAFALSELVVLVGSMVALPRGALGLASVLDVGRAIASAAATLMVFRLLPELAPWAGVPLCVVVFAAASYGLGLLSRGDLAMLQSLVRRPRAAPQAGASEASETQPK